MRIATFGLDCLPAVTTASEQLVNNAAALARSGIEVDLMVQPHDADTRPPRERAAAIAEFYGLPSDAFNSGLNLVEIPVPSWLRGNAKRAAFSFLARRKTLRLGRLNASPYRMGLSINPSSKPYLNALRTR